MISLDASVLPRLSAKEAQELEKRSPGHRGYWLDHEMLEASGLGSIAVLKRAQAVGWIKPHHVPVPGGGRRRAWTLREVAYAELLVEIARRALIPVQSAAALLASVGREWVNRAMGVEEELRMAAGHPGRGIRVAGTRLLLIDMTEAWAETLDENLGGDFVLVASEMVLIGPNNLFGSRDAVVPTPSDCGRASLDSLLEDAAVATLIAVDAIALRSIDAAQEARRNVQVEDDCRG